MPFRQMFAMHVRPQLKELYVSIGIFSFAVSLIAIFEPIFLYQQGFPLWAIALYYALHYALYVVLLPLGGKFSSKFGHERSIVASLPLFVVYFICLSVLPQFPLAIVGAILFLTVHKILYWPAQYVIFARFSDANNRGTEISWLGAFRHGASIAGPAIGGAIATTWGFPILFLSAGVLILFSGIPLMRMQHAHRISDFSYTSPWKMMRLPMYRKTFTSTIGWGENLIDAAFWPLFLFVALGSFDAIGLYLSLSLVIMTLVGFFIGDRAERSSKEKLLRAYVPFTILSYALRIFAVSPLRIIVTDSIARIAFVGVTIPMMYKVYSQARGTRSLEFMVAFEIILAISKAVTACLLALFFILLPVHAAFIASFCLGMLLALFYWRL